MKKSWICLLFFLIVLTVCIPTAAADDTSVLSAFSETESEVIYSEDNRGEMNDIPDASSEPKETEEPVDSEELLLQDPDSTAPFSISYTTHVQTYGWLDPVTDGDVSGTTGQSKRMEGIRISLENDPYSGSVQYCTHVQTYGWQDWCTDGEKAGTEGESKRLEAIRIRLTDELAEHFDIWYQTHIQHFGWSGWAKNGESCGSAGYSYRLEAIRICLLPKESPTPGSVTGIFYEKNAVPEDGAFAYANTLLRYSTHVQTYGWQPFVFDGATAGTTRQSKRLEGISIRMNDAVEGGIRYRTHVQSYGWQGWRSDGQIAGTVGEAKRLEAIRIELTGEAANTYDVYYRVHSQTFGWMAWTKNGQSAGTEGMRKRLEAIEIVLIPKNKTIPGYDPARAFKTGIKGSTVTWIGDSYSAINKSLIASKLPGVDIQAQSAKFISYGGVGGTPGIPLTAGLKQNGQLRKTVVFALGTNSNDGVTQDELNQLRGLFGDSYKVVFVTAMTNRSAYASGNTLLRSFTNQYSNYYLYDWAAHFNPAYMGGDGIHPNSTGITVWVDGIIDTLNSTV